MFLGVGIALVLLAIVIAAVLSAIRFFPASGRDHSSSSALATTTESLLAQEDTKSIYTITANHVYLNDASKGPSIIPEADPKTFEALSGKANCAAPAYARDKDHVYFFGAIVDNVDPATFTVLELPYAKDAQHVFVGGFNVDETVQSMIIPDADPNTFRVLHIAPSTTCAGDEFEFARDASHMFISGNMNPVMDPNSFTYLSSSFFADRNHVYDNRGNLIPDADPKSFVLLSEGLSKDKNHVYIHEQGFELDDYVVIKEADTVTFREIKDPIFIDKNHVYDIPGFYDPNFSITSADPATFSDAGGFYHDKNHVYELVGGYGEGGVQYFKKLPDADPATFTSLDGRYSKDATRVYFDDRIVASADPKTFAPVRLAAPHPTDTDPYLPNIAEDEHHVFNRDAVISGLVPGDLRAIGSYLTDGVSVAYDDFDQATYDPSVVFKLVAGADPKTFVDMGGGYAKDTSHVYFQGNLIGAADPASFSSLNSSGSGTRYAKDKRSLFADGRKVEQNGNIDFASFVILGYFAKDKNTVYYLGGEGGSTWLPLVGANPTTFEVIPSPSTTEDPLAAGQYAKDAQHVYLNGDEIHYADPASFQVLKSAYGDYYSKDATRAYYKGREIVGADASSFIADSKNGTRARDKNYLYSDGKVERLTDEQIVSRNP